jgi:Mg2+/Co2+ transporter CorC
LSPPSVITLLEFVGWDETKQKEPVAIIRTAGVLPRAKQLRRTLKEFLGIYEYLNIASD